MAISKGDAIKTALAFAAREYKDSKFNLSAEDARARIENEGFGYRYLGMSKTHWSVLIPTKTDDPSIAVTDPGFVIVLVSDDGTKTCWFPVM